MNRSNTPSKPGKEKQSPCAACERARKQCTADCLLRPYIPNDAEHKATYQNVLKLFGKKNVLNLLKKLQQPDQRDDAMTSITFEANARASFPVQGCVYMINRLVANLRAEESQLEQIRQQLALVKSRSSSNVLLASCAACAFENQICSLECPFRNYFPNDDEENRTAYLKLQKLFEYGNVLNWVEGLSPKKRDLAMKSFIFEAEVWDKNPGRGCLYFMNELRKKISADLAELHGLQQLLAPFRGQFNQEPLGESRSSSSVPHGPNVQLGLATGGMHPTHCQAYEQSTSYAAQSTSCAACASEKQICNLECPFRNYFPTDDEENIAAYIKFQKMNGNVFNIVMSLRPEERDVAMKFFFSEADMWDKNPDGGCSSFVQEPLEKISTELEELHGFQQLLGSVRGQTNQEPLGESSMNIDGAV